jgi:hypothetical protein
MFQTESLDHALLPACITEGPTAFEACAEPLEFFGGYRCIDVCNPILPPWDRPVTEHFALRLGSIFSYPKAAPSPILGLTHQTGGKRISLDVAAYGRQMFVSLDGKAFEPLRLCGTF